MPGKVVKIRIAHGDEVSAGTPLLVLEAMKMEHVIHAPSAGIVGALRVAVGDQVTANQVLGEIA